MSRPNIVFITCHDLGGYLGCCSTPVDTPNIDSIASNGVLFDFDYTTKVCSPSRGDNYRLLSSYKRSCGAYAPGMETGCR